MNKLIISLCILGSACNATESKKQPTVVSCYSSMSSKKQKHELTMSDGTRITLQSSLADPQDIKITVRHKHEPEGKK